MSYTHEELTLVFDWLRARTVDRPGHQLPRSLAYGLLRRWAEQNGYSARPNTSALTALMRQAGYPLTPYRTLSKTRRYAFTGLDLLPKKEGQA